jgi:hypothetical protein
MPSACFRAGGWAVAPRTMSRLNASGHRRGDCPGAAANSGGDSGLRFGAALLDEAREQEPHRRDRLNASQRKIAEDEGRIAEC